MLPQKSNIKRKVIARNCRSVIQGLDMTTPVFDPMKCIVKVASAAQVSERTKRHAFIMMNELLRRKTLTAGKDPMGLATSILSVACKETGENKTQKNMAKAAGVTEVTIRNRIRDLEKKCVYHYCKLFIKKFLIQKCSFWDLSSAIVLTAVDLMSVFAIAEPVHEDICTENINPNRFFFYPTPAGD